MVMICVSVAVSISSVTVHPSPQDVVLTDDQTFDDKQREVRISGKEDFLDASC